MDILSDLIGFSIFMLPLILLISWVLFRALHKSNSESRIPLILGICLVVTLGLITTRQYGAQRGFAFTRTDWINLLDGAVVAVIGVAVWGKAKRNTRRDQE